MTRALLALLLVLAPASLKAATIDFRATLNGGTLGALGVGDWNTTACGVVAYWPMDEETDSADRVPTVGSCPDAGTDCDLSTNSESFPDVAGIRGRAVHLNSTSDALSCADGTCDELDLSGTSFTITGWVNAGVACFGVTYLVNKKSGSDGFSINASQCVGTSTVQISVEDATLAFSNIASSADGDHTFIGLSYNEVTDELLGCVGTNDGLATMGIHWECKSTTVTGPLAATSVDFNGCQTTGDGSTIHCDELTVVEGVAYDRRELCRVCSCFQDGSDCSGEGATWVDKGMNASHCEDCDLPSPARSCPQ